ncbi:hypothetical protein HDV00_003454 [Rhizophlyctis rosea]|nr:hypothetical protein HDV00_003454 [Rhizophlyctis rosea]
MTLSHGRHRSDNNDIFRTPTPSGRSGGGDYGRTPHITAPTAYKNGPAPLPSNYKKPVELFEMSETIVQNQQRGHYDNRGDAYGGYGGAYGGGVYGGSNVGTSNLGTSFEKESSGLGLLDHSQPPGMALATQPPKSFKDKKAAYQSLYTTIDLPSAPPSRPYKNPKHIGEGKGVTKERSASPSPAAPELDKRISRLTHEVGMGEPNVTVLDGTATAGVTPATANGPPPGQTASMTDFDKRGSFGWWDEQRRFHQGYRDSRGRVRDGFYDERGVFHFWDEMRQEGGRGSWGFRSADGSDRGEEVGTPTTGTGKGTGKGTSRKEDDDARGYYDDLISFRDDDTKSWYSDEDRRTRGTVKRDKTRRGSWDSRDGSSQRSSRSRRSRSVSEFGDRKSTLRRSYLSPNVAAAAPLRERGLKPNGLQVSDSGIFTDSQKSPAASSADLLEHSHAPLPPPPSTKRTSYLGRWAERTAVVPERQREERERKRRSSGYSAWNANSQHTAASNAVKWGAHGDSKAGPGTKGGSTGWKKNGGAGHTRGMSTATSLSGGPPPGTYAPRTTSRKGPSGHAKGPSNGGRSAAHGTVTTRSTDTRGGGAYGGGYDNDTASRALAVIGSGGVDGAGRWRGK